MEENCKTYCSIIILQIIEASGRLQEAEKPRRVSVQNKIMIVSLKCHIVSVLLVHQTIFQPNYECVFHILREGLYNIDYICYLGKPAVNL